MATSSIDGTFYNSGWQIMELINAEPDLNNIKLKMHVDNTWGVC